MSWLIAFSGQGSAHRAMFRLLSTDTFGKEWLQEASDVLQMNLFDENVVAAACTDVVKVQSLLVLLAVGTFRVLQPQFKIDPQFLCGYSLGEVSAFCVSANVGVRDICDIVTYRATSMQIAAIKSATNQDTGLAVLKGRVNLNLVLRLLEQHNVYLAIVNAADHYIIGGLRDNLEQVLLAAKQQGVLIAEPLVVKLPAHTPMLSAATKDFLTYLKTREFAVMRYPILNTLTQELISNVDLMLPILAQELSSTLPWNRVMAIAVEYGVKVVVELGTGTALKSMFLTQHTDLTAYSAEEFSTIRGLLDMCMC